ncbi:MAG: CBS domain-containing protein [Candidatus Thermoplasmatota archaeon]|nr:CBS domain-containing protein [Candidatus Thermoplasmatota archaeon]MDI6887250.1 CBS domain-containing protein [Candidatus Thermoplasmatota archaeon]
MLVKDVMTKYVITLAPENTIREASEKLASKNISGAPVVDKNNKVMGILSEADILRVLKTRYSAPNIVFLPTPFDLIEIPFRQAITFAEVKLSLEDISRKKVTEVMTKNPIVIGCNDTVEKAAEIMVERKVNRLPVVENDKLIGIITRGDIIRSFAGK